jgi:hypothetical protein
MNSQIAQRLLNSWNNIYYEMALFCITVINKR